MIFILLSESKLQNLHIQIRGFVMSTYQPGVLVHWAVVFHRILQINGNNIPAQGLLNWYSNAHTHTHTAVCVNWEALCLQVSICHCVKSEPSLLCRFLRAARPWRWIVWANRATLCSVTPSDLLKSQWVVTWPGFWMYSTRRFYIVLRATLLMLVALYIDFCFWHDI